MCVCVSLCVRAYVSTVLLLAYRRHLFNIGSRVSLLLGAVLIQNSNNNKNEEEEERKEEDTCMFSVNEGVETSSWAIWSW